SRWFPERPWEGYPPRTRWTQPQPARPPASLERKSPDNLLQIVGIGDSCVSVRGRAVIIKRPGTELGRDGWPTQAVFWLEWGSSFAGQSLPAARSRLLATHSHSISTRPSHPVAYCRKLLHSQSSARSHNPRFTGLR